MKTEILTLPDSNAIPAARALLALGGSVVFPTDTVYGLATSAFNSDGIDKLFKIKQRSPQKSIAVLIGQIDDLPKVAAHPSERILQMAAHFWPGALTLIFPRNPSLPALISADDTVGVRIPDHPFAIELLKATGPLAVSSANLSGSGNTCTADEVLKDLRGKIDLLIDGGHTPGGQPSTVARVKDSQIDILREGPIPGQALLDFILKK